jgi:hypothetical protein
MKDEGTNWVKPAWKADAAAWAEREDDPDHHAPGHH